MKTTCAYCGIVDRPHICPYRKRRTDRTRIDNKIYESKEYRKLRKEVLEDFNYVDVFSFYIEDKGIEADTTHHIIEVLEDRSKANDYNNLIPLSEKCHKLVHVLYRNKKIKYKIQDLLRRMREEYLKGDRTIGKFAKEYEKIVSPPTNKISE